MRGSLFVAAVLVCATAHASDEDRRAGAPGTTDATLELSFARFDRFYDDDGKSRPLSSAFGGDAKDVVVDTLLFQFGGRIVLGPGLEASVDVPLVRNARSGRIESLLGNESLFAESLAMGDVSASARFEIPLDVGEVESGFGVAGTLKAPTGVFEDLESDQIATGGGDWGIGGELFAVARPFRLELGASAALMLLLPHERDEVEVDRGDPRHVRAWLDAPMLSARSRIGLEVHGLVREADRAAGEEVGSLGAGGQPGALAPASRLVSLAPYVEIRPYAGARFLASAGAPATGWLFLPQETGLPLSGKNVLRSQMQLRVFFLSGF